MKKIYTYIFIVIALIALAFLLLMLSPWLNIKEIQINGTERVEESYIIRELNLDKTTNILAFNNTFSKKTLKKNYYIENVSIKKVFPSTIIINISERELAGYIPYANDYLYIDKDGMVIDIKPNFTERLPLINGLKFDNFTIGKPLQTENKDAFEIIVEMARLISTKDALDDIISIDVSDTENIKLYINNIDVILGNRDDLNIKINTLNEIVKNFSTEEKGFLYIDDIDSYPIFKYLT